MPYSITYSPNAPAGPWTRKDEMTWEEVIDWLDLDHPAETKECGGYVAGRLHGSRRTEETVIDRSILTLDADYADQWFLADLTMALDEGWVAHTTWRSTPDAPRWRVLIPLSRPVSADDYWIIAHLVMSAVGRESFDPDSPQAERFMYLPSAQDPTSYECRFMDGEPLDVEAWLQRGEEVLSRHVERVGTAADADLDAPATDAEIDKAHTLLNKACEEIREGRVIDRRTGEVVEGRNNGCIRWLPLLYQFAIGGCFDRETVDKAVWEAVQDAGGDHPFPESEYATVSGSAWGLAEADGPQRPDVGEVFAPVVEESRRERLDVTSPGETAEWCRREMGAEGSPLAGLFRRGDDLVYTPRMGEGGYREPSDDEALLTLGPATVRRVSATALAARLDAAYRVVRVSAKGGVSHTVFPREITTRLVESVDLLVGVRPLQLVTHTPIMLGDGTVHDTPGYRDGILYLPDAGLDVPPVPERPGTAEIDRARGVLDDMLGDFPWVTAGDRANFEAALFTPLLREVVGPPYKLVAIGAPQPGSGKSLLGEVLRTVHGGVFRTEFPRNEEELGKQITAILDTTSAPVVQFDNVAGIIASPKFDGLLTSADYSDRLLGSSRNIHAVNDRLWVVTGNNLTLGGDLRRRALRVTINAGVERPEERTGFRIDDLSGWVASHRGEIIWSLLVLARSWVLQGRPVPEQRTTDSYGRWISVMSGIVGSEVAAVETEGENDVSDPDGWGDFLMAVHEAYGSKPWTAKELLTRVEFGEVPLESLPEEIAAKIARGIPATKSLGWWLRNRTDRWVGGLAVRRQAVGGSKASVWYVSEAAQPEGVRFA